MHARPLRMLTIVVVPMLVALGLATSQARAETLDQFFDSFTAECVRGDPDLATSLRYFQGEEQRRLERQLTPRTQRYAQERIALARQGLKRLNEFDAAKFSDTQRISAELMHWQLDTIVSSEPFLDYTYPLEQFRGTNVDLVETFTLRHPVNTAADADNYLARLAWVNERMDEALAEAKRLATAKMIPPRFILDATLKSMRTFIEAAPEQNPLVTVFAQKLDAIDGLTVTQRNDLRTKATTIVKNEIYPAWARAIALLESIVPQSTNDAGLWRLPGGDKAYANALARFTTTAMTPDEIHEIGLRRLAEIEAEMDAILRRIGRSEGSVGERMQQLEIDLRYPNPESEESRSKLMADLEALMKDAIVRSTPMFEQMPQTPVIAQPFPRFREASAAANYNRAPLDGSRPAIFQMPLRPQRMTRLGLRTLVYHETIPGHHYQIALEQENASLPRFRQARALGGISAMSEGWALYAEKLAAESGWYDDDPEGLLGQLSGELWRARRLVVDTGLHAKKWTRQQAIDFGIEASEIDRYVVMPGQACSYMIGQLRILAMRDRAREQLGARFSLKGFHSAVLKTGTVPLELLEREVMRWASNVPAHAN
jgi:uncharacterized protein (DUF885 family)